MLGKSLVVSCLVPLILAAGILHAHAFDFLPAERETEMPTSSSERFHEMLERHRVIDLLPVEAEIMCEIGDSLSCGKMRFYQKVQELSEYEGIDLLVRLEELYDSIPYARDHENFGQDDYWATPEEFLERRLGDCEEYAIAKYLTLKELGWSDDDMRIVVLWDSRIQEHHAVVAVRHEGREWLLDNAYAGLRESHHATHYHPIEAMNETGSWSYRRGANGPHMVASDYKTP